MITYSELSAKAERVPLGALDAFLGGFMFLTLTASEFTKK